MQKAEAREDQKLELLVNSFKFLENKIDSMSSQLALDELKRIERKINAINMGALDSNEYNQVIEIKSSILEYKKLFLNLIKSEKYGPPLLKGVKQLVMEYLNNGNDTPRADNITAYIIDFLENLDNISIYESQIKRLISGKMKRKEFIELYELIKARKGNTNENEFVPYKKYLNDIKI